MGEGNLFREKGFPSHSPPKSFEIKQGKETYICRDRRPRLSAYVMYKITLRSHYANST